MARKIISLLILVCITSCGVVRKKTTYSEERKIAVKAGNKDRVNPYKSSEEPDIEAADGPSAAMPVKAEQIISTAMTYSGVRYKFVGTTRKGMDCSGLLYVAFAEHDIPLPRISYQMAEEGKHIRITQVAKGDLLFFKTSRKGKNINHVGLVVAVEGDDVKFIHSTTSRGVIVSSLHEGFWNYAFVKATRVL
jgi:cell wall-associated NlpC family hydrolase